jgi:hypothetical protein
MSNYPKCFDSLAQFKLWKEAAKHASTGQSYICADCLPEYQNKMILQKRCAKPLAHFIKVDGELVGKAKWSA